MSDPASPTPPPPTPASKDKGAIRPTRANPGQATSSAAHVAPLPDDDDPLLGFAPYLHSAPRGNSITPDLQRRFIATLAATGIVKQAAKSIGKSLEALYKLRHRPGAEEFSAAWDAALERGVQRLEDCALERAIKGTSTPIVSGGEILGYWDKPDNHLLRFLLQHRLRGRYSAESQKVGPGHPVYEEMLAEARQKVAEVRRQMSKQVTARAIALHTLRRRRIFRDGQKRQEGAPPPRDAWDQDDENGMPQIPQWGHPYNDHYEQAQELLEEMEREDKQR